jgi:hypothetical protein
MQFTVMNSNTNNDNLNLSLEYIVINNELWEIDYNKGHAIEVSEYKRREFLKNIIEYFNGTIEDFLTKERGCRDIHFHNSMNLPRIHMKKYGKDAKTICTFRKDINK